MLSFHSATTGQLAALADQAIHDVLLRGGIRSAPPTGEVSAVKSVVLDGFDEIARQWGPELRKVGYRLELTSVFTHCRPHVIHPSGVCELADLLVVADECTIGGRVLDRRAVLVQAKTLKGPKIKLSTKEKVQFDLLFGWPSFTFKDSGYDSRARDFHDPHASADPHLSGEYGAIDLRKVPRTWVQQLTQNPYDFKADVHLGTYLAKMIVGASNHGRAATAGGLDDWSFTVDELLRITAAKGITQGSATQRGNPNTIGYTSPGSAAGPPGAGSDDAPWGEGPISIVHARALLDREGPSPDPSKTPPDRPRD